MPRYYFDLRDGKTLTRYDVPLPYSRPPAFLVPLITGNDNLGYPEKEARPAGHNWPRPQIGMRWQDPELVAIDECAKQNGANGRPEAIRRLIKLGLKVKAKG